MISWSFVEERKYLFAGCTDARTQKVLALSESHAPAQSDFDNASIKDQLGSFSVSE